MIKGGLARNKVIAEIGQMFELNELIRVKKGALVGRVNLTTPYWVFSLRLRITSADQRCSKSVLGIDLILGIGY